MSSGAAKLPEAGVDDASELDHLRRTSDVEDALRLLCDDVEPVVLERKGKPAAVMVQPDLFERMHAALEDQIDAEAIEDAMNEAKAEGTISWDRLKHDLAL